MSARSLCSQRCTVISLEMTDIDGAAVYDWRVTATNVPVRVDTFGKGQSRGDGWSPEAGRPADRAGIAFFMPEAPIKPGSRIVMTRGMAGSFTLGSEFNQALNRRGRVHHLEVQVTEVAQALATIPTST